MRYDAVLFDLDGTLIASAPGIIGSVYHTLDTMGIERPPEDSMHRFIGPSMHDSMQRFCGMTPDQAEAGLATYREHYAEHGVLDAVVYTGVPNLLRALKANGAYVAIASSKPLPMAKRVLEHFGLLRFFDKVVGAESERRETEKLSLLRDALPTKYNRAAMVGDRRFDMEAAKQLGIEAIGAGWGYGTPEELLGAGADVVADTMDDCTRLLLGKQAEEIRGLFVSVEGLDGSGKTTQMNAVADHLRTRGYDVLCTREPGGTPVSEEIRQLVLDPKWTVSPETEALLYAASRAQLVTDVIRPAIAQGRIVLCDRFVDSSIVYQGAGRELGLDRVAAINEFGIGETMPDLTLLLVVEAQTAFLRRSSATNLDRLERAGEAFFARVYSAYAKLAKENPKRIRCVDGLRPVEEVTADVCAQIDRLLAVR